MLIDQNCSIPGVKSNSKFELWLTKNDRISSRNVVVKESCLGGIGLFYKQGELNNDEDIGERVILRIKGFWYDYMTLMKDLEKLQPENSKIVKLVLKAIEPTSETSILKSYFIAFKICMTLNKTVKDLYLDDIIPYVDVLSNTSIGKFDIDIGNISQSKGFESGYLLESKLKYEMEFEKYQQLLKELGNELDKPFEYLQNEVFDFTTFYQIGAAVRSRVLEIPYEDEEEDKNDSKSSTYYTNITLVPFLDFANHSNVKQMNAFFDVDRNNGDILLKLDSDELKDGEEITICYSPDENIQSMITTYGFIPQNYHDSTQTFEIKISHEWLNQYIDQLHGTKNIEYSLICKWLDISVNFKMMITGDDVVVTYQSETLPIIFAKNLEYDLNWKNKLFEVKDGPFSSIVEVEEQLEIVHLIENLKLISDYFPGLPPIAVLVKGKSYSYNDLFEALGIETEDNLYNLKRLVLEMIHQYCLECITNDNNELMKNLSLQNNNDVNLQFQYIQTEINILEKFEKAYERNPELVIPIYEEV